jgi:hypothetical protein
MERQNIIELIGRNTGKYNSCIITTYSFDFPFFENRLLRSLRLAQIKNINVFVDAKSLDDNLELYKGNEYQTTSSYSIIPVREVGVFHPKIMFLAGPKDGLIILGSGNVTSSGISTNDEIWGAFHLNDMETTHSSLFKQVWDYLQIYIQHTKGFNKIKLNRILQLCPWINKLNSVSKDLIIVNGDTEIQFWTNTKENSIYNLMIKELRNKQIKSSLIVSPFFDKNGTFITNIINDLKLDFISCITDKEIGSLPEIVDLGLLKRLQFYNWKRNDELIFDHLHAKFYHFSTLDKMEYLILGSANATIQAFGSKTLPAVNAEAVLFLKRPLAKKSFLQELNIEINKLAKFDLTGKSKVSNNNLIKDSIKYKTIIESSELDGNKLKIYLNKTRIQNVEVIILDKAYQILHKALSVVNNSEIEIVLQSRNQIYKVFIADGNERISNYSHVHSVSTLLNTITDSSTDKISNLIELIGTDPESEKMAGLLSHLNYNWIYDEERELKDGTQYNKRLLPIKSKENESRALTPEEYKKLTDDSIIHTSVLNSSNVLISNCLNAMARSLKIASIDVEESEEQKMTLLDRNNANGAGKEVQFNFVNHNACIQLKNAVDNVLNTSIDKLCHDKIAEYATNEYFTLEILVNFSVCVELLFIFYDKPYNLIKTRFLIYNDRLSTQDIGKVLSKYRLQPLKEISDNYNLYLEIDSTLFPSIRKELNSINDYILSKKVEPQEIVSKKYYLEQQKIAKDGDLNYYLEHLVDNFLILFDLSKGFQKYEYELMNQKMLDLIENIFFKATYLGLILPKPMFESELNKEILEYLLVDFYSKNIAINKVQILNTLYDLNKLSNNNQEWFVVNIEKYKKLLDSIY